MSFSLLALLGYAAWTLSLVGLIATLRTALTLSGKYAANGFSPTGDDVSPFANRLCRAHANCCENLPIFGAIIGVAALSGSASVTDGLALWVLGARVAQSIIHLVSTSELAVMVRFGAFAVQIGVQIGWVVSLIGGWAG
ncbi:MAG: putative MAPEG superfamily protein [Bradymonadia bacterium]|jgi:uncharacterized MAPEG superfamily protein